MLGVPEDEPRGPREPLSRALSRTRSSRRRSRRTTPRRSSGIARSSRRSRRTAVAGHQLPARGPVARERRFRRGRARVRAHGLQLRAARARVGGRLRGDLRASRAARRPRAPSSNRSSSARPSRARCGSPTRSPSTSTRPSCSAPRPRISTRSRTSRRPRPPARTLIERYPDGRARAAAHGVDGRRAFVVRARRLSGGRARVRRGARADAGRGRGAASARRQPRGVDLQAGRAGQRSAGLSRRGGPLPAHHGARADVVDSPGRRVRRGGGAHEAAGLDGGRRGARRVPRGVPGSRAER